ncbi:MAG: CheY-like chemotaxis protein [Planctomycetota bacterium]|jgi:CheY-like chemotaxis protein
MNSASPLSILIAGKDLDLIEALAAQLEKRGHSGSIADRVGEVLALPTPDVLILDANLEDGAGFTLLAELKRRGNTPRVVMFADKPRPEDFRAALRLGASDLIPAPFTFEDLLRTVEAKPLGGQVSDGLKHTIDATTAGVEQGSREVAAWLLRAGVAPTTRCRVSSAVAEALDNVSRHAYLGGVGPVELRGSLTTRSLELTIRDRGVGISPNFLVPAYLEDTEGGGLARMCALAEDLDVDVLASGGTRITLSFSIYNTQFDEERGQDLSDLDFLTPQQAHKVLDNLQDAGAAPLQLSPALAVSVGRLLAGPDPQRVLETSLRS